jgi:hypothetical protein
MMANAMKRETVLLYVVVELQAICHFAMEVMQVSCSKMDWQLMKTPNSSLDESIFQFGSEDFGHM